MLFVSRINKLQVVLLVRHLLQKSAALQYIVNAEGRLKTPDEFGNIVLRTNQDGSLLKLKDIARIVMDQRSYDFSYS